MDMHLNPQIIKNQRIKRAWSQSELAEVSGLSLRTVQRIEKSGIASLDSVKALACAFEVTPESLQSNDVIKSDDMRDGEAQLQQSVSPHSLTPKLNQQAIQVSLCVCFPSAVVVLFFLFTNIPNLEWVHSVRETLFSDALPASIKVSFNILIALLPVFVASITVGLIMDIAKKQGAWFWLKYWLNHPPSLKTLMTRISSTSVRIFSLIRKPILFSVVLISVSITAIATTMEPYQKENLNRLIERVLESKGE